MDDQKPPSVVSEDMFYTDDGSVMEDPSVSVFTEENKIDFRAESALVAVQPGLAAALNEESSSKRPSQEQHPAIEKNAPMAPVAVEVAIEMDAPDNMKRLVGVTS
ncbi:phospholipid-transporting ATPase IA, partial [Biomphalaria pfeifferi]